MDISQSLIKVGLPAPAARLFMRLLEVKRASARELAEHLGMTRPSVYDNLKFLTDRGLVTEMNEDSKKLFHVDDARNLTGFVESEIEALSKEKKALEELLPKFSGPEVGAPSIKAYSGVDGIKRILGEMLWHRNIETRTVWPTNDMAEVLGDEFLADLNRKRIKRGISVKSIWPTDEFSNLKKFPFLGVGGGHLRERRIAPHGMRWSMSYWQYADKVAFISSHKESFGFVVQSKDLVSLITVNFDALWQISAPTSPEPQYTDEFLKTV